MYYELIYFTGLHDSGGGYTTIPCFIEDEDVTAMLSNQRPAFISVLLSSGQKMIVNVQHINLLKEIPSMENPQGTMRTEPPD